MNRTSFRVLSSLVGAILTLSATAYAADQNKSEAARKPDLAKGEMLYAKGDAGRNVPACSACHGAAGNSTIPQNPRLAAQHENYIYKQLIDFKKDERANPIMSTFAKVLNEDEMKDVAAYLDVQTRQPAVAKSPEAANLGKKIYQGGIAEKNVPACAGCHSPNGSGIPAQFPRVGGQHQDYTVAQLKGFRSGTRKNSVQMAAIAKRMSDEEIQSVSEYIAGQ